MARTSEVSTTAELSILYEILLLRFSESLERLGEEVIEKATRLFGVRRLALLVGKGDTQRLIASLAFRNEKEIANKIGQNKPDQFKFDFGSDGKIGTLFMEKANTIETKERRLYTNFARQLENAIVVAKEAAERKQIEEALQASEEFSSILLSNAPYPLFVTNADTSIRYVNLALEKLSGFSLTELIGKKAPYPWWTEETLPKIEQDFKEAIRKGAKGREELFKKKNGERFWVSIHATPIVIDGEYRYYLANWVDITERKRVEEMIKQAAQEWRTTFDSIPDLVAMVDKDFKLVRVNKSFADAVKMKPQELIGRAYYEVLYGKDEPIPECPHKKVLETKKPATVELYEPHLGAYLEVSASPIFNDQREVVSTVHITKDITERKRAEEEIKKFKTISDRAGYGTAITNLEGEFIYLNESLAQMHGYTPDELSGKHFSILFTEDSLKRLGRLRNQLIQKGTHFNEELWRKRKDGTVFPTLTTAVIIKDDNGKPLYIAATAIDITERKQWERKLQEKNERLDTQNEELQSQSEELMAQGQELIEKTRELEVASKAKSEFMAHMSHELRTPLNVIIGFSELMMDGVAGEVNEEQRQCLNDVLGSGQHLLGLINDILDLSKIESGKMELKLRNVALPGIIESLRSEMMPLVTKRNQSLDVIVEKGLPSVRADKAKIRQVLINLLSNSTKFTPEGGKLQVEAVREDGWCRVSVIDNGIGISKENQKKIFEPFSQLESPLPREAGGTGLGLAIARQIIKKHGGRIWVESEYGEGSRFNFTLPLANAGRSYPRKAAA